MGCLNNLFGDNCLCTWIAIALIIILLVGNAN